jgi:hypothetical protein
MSARPPGAQGLRADVSAYLRAQAVPLHSAAEAQKKWAPQIQQLFEQIKQGKAQVAALNARSIGRQYGDVFRKCLKQAEALQPPQPALRCQEYLVRWLKALVNACDALSHAPEDGKDQAYVRDAHDYLDDARYAVKPMTEIRQRLYELAQGKTSPAKPAGS